MREAPRHIGWTVPKIRDIDFGVFDIETRGLGGEFIDSHTWQQPGEPVLRQRTVADLFDTLIHPDRPALESGRPSRRAFTWLAHNGASFDFTYLAIMLRDYAISQGVQIETTSQGNKLIQLTIPTPEGKVKLRDSFPLFNCALAVASKAYAPEYAKSEHCPDHDFTKSPPNITSRVVTPDARRSMSKVIREEWEAAAHGQYLAAVKATNGYMLSPKAPPGTHEFQLWTVPEKRAASWASEELRNFWYANPRLTLAEYRRRREDADARAREEWEESGVSDGPVPEAVGGVFYDPDCPRCVGYAKQDVISLWHTYNNCRQLVIDTFGVEPAITMGATAMRAWLTTLEKGKVYYRQNPKVERFLRNFTTGAYITPGCTSKTWLPPEGYTYAAMTADRSAAFAACMYQGRFPTDAGVWTGEYEPGVVGFYECDAHCPRDQHPVVPLINSEGEKHWATGHGTAYVTNEQYEMCLTHRYELTVKRGVVFERTEDIFSSFIRKCEDLEYPPDGSKADPGIKTLAKGMRNSLNGKFNIREEQDQVFIGDPPEGSIPVIDEDTGDPLPLYVLREKVDAPYTHPEWYALVVTRQQMEEIRLVDLMDPSERGKADTDSVTSSERFWQWAEANGHVTIGPGYGAYKYEHRWLTHRSIGPKNYYGTEVVEDDEFYTANCKGIPKKLIRGHLREEHELAAEGEQVQITFESTRSMKEMLAHQYETPGVVRVRSLGTPDSVLGWVHDNTDRSFRPIHFEES